MLTVSTKCDHVCTQQILYSNWLIDIWLKRKLRTQKHREEEREFNRRRKERGGRKGEKERDRKKE